MCNYIYNSPMKVTEVQCPKTHTAAEVARAAGTSIKSGRSGHAVMELIEGSINETKRKKSTNEQAVRGPR